jgi:hypothetical protein
MMTPPETIQRSPSTGSEAPPLITSSAAAAIRLTNAVKPGSSFFATFFEIPLTTPRNDPFIHPGGITTHGDRDPYHFHFRDVELCCRDLAWSAIYIGEWQHPRNQKMIRFKKG